MVVNEQTWRGTAPLFIPLIRQHHWKSETLALRLLYNIRYDIIIRRGIWYCTLYNDVPARGIIVNQQSPVWPLP
jgi:hypothetical protein